MLESLLLRAPTLGSFCSDDDAGYVANIPAPSHRLTSVAIVR